jgi:hypothetical protein
LLDPTPERWAANSGCSQCWRVRRRRLPANSANWAFAHEFPPRLPNRVEGFLSRARGAFGVFAGRERAMWARSAGCRVAEPQSSCAGRLWLPPPVHGGSPRRLRISLHTRLEQTSAPASPVGIAGRLELGAVQASGGAREVSQHAVDNLEVGDDRDDLQFPNRRYYKAGDRAGPGAAGRRRRLRPTQLPDPEHYRCLGERGPHAIAGGPSGPPVSGTGQRGSTTARRTD